MIRNYIKIAFRNLTRNSAYAFINITGLAVGLTAFILIFLWIQDELSFDRYNAKADRLFRAVENQYYANNERFPVAVTPAPLGPYLKANFPEIVNATRLSQISMLFQYEDISFNEFGLMADPTFIDMFSLEFVKGEQKNAFSNLESIIVSETLAKKYFKAEDPIGKVFKLNNNDFAVTGVFRDIPDNSHLQFDYIFPFEYFKKFGWDDLTSWVNNRYYTYVQLDDKANMELVDAKIKDARKKNISGPSTTEIFLQPLTSIHLRSKFTADITGHGDIQYVYIFSAVAVFVLLIACVNFMNLSTARSARRSKEVGMRKVIGAQRAQLIRQFLAESVVLSFIALLIALVLVKLLLSAFNALAGKNLILAPSPTIVLTLLLIAFTTGIVAGSYPALFLSSFKPVKALKGMLKTGKAALAFRKVLVVGQFLVSIALIAGMLVIYNQLDFIRNKELGFEKKNVVSFSYYPIRGKAVDFKNALLANKSIGGVTCTDNTLTYVGNSSSDFDWEGRTPDKDILLHRLSIDFDFIKTFKIELLEGRNFSADIASDSLAVIVNEEALKQMDLKDPINKRWGQNGKIIGVVKNFHFKSVHEKIEPLVLFVDPTLYNLMYVRIDGKDLKSAVAEIEQVHKNFAPDEPFDYAFLDDEFDKLYRSEQRTGTIFNYFSSIGIFISCLGLFGLVMFTTEQRTKEIGVRKVHGASVGSVVSLISLDFIKLIVISNAIALPMAWYFMNKWLDTFAYRISIHWSILFIAGASSLAIAWLTMAYQSIRAAAANPVKSLRAD